MQVLTQSSEPVYCPLGQRRGVSKLARFALDLSWARAETECPTGSRAYPSPPMSGSPPPPSKPYPEADIRGRGGFQATTHDAYRAHSAVPGADRRLQMGAAPQPQLPPPSHMTTGVRPYPLESAEQTAFPYRRPEESIGRSMPYQSQPGPMISPHQYSLPPVVGHAPGSSPYSLPTRPQPPESAPYTSPKSQRKTKGHVASACVPCKRAHLRYSLSRLVEITGHEANNRRCDGTYWPNL